MAYIEKTTTKKQTTYRLRLTEHEYPGRPRIALGKCARKQAETACAQVEQLLASNRTGAVIPPATQAWVAGLPDNLHQRLEELRLVLPRVNSRRYTVAAWVNEYMEKRTDIKPRTRENMNQARRALLDFAGDLSLVDFTPGHAQDLHRSLVAKGLAPATVNRRCKRIRQFFNAAMDHRLITENPFAGIRAGTMANPTRARFVDQDTICRVIDACPNAQWRLLFALARFGGLRIPSEIERMRWDDIDWLNARFVVRSCKTEHIANKDKRTVPLFPELEPFFQAALDESKTGQDLVFPELAKRSNLRTQALRIVRKTGLEPWPRLFSNLRASRETELVEEYPVHVVADWLGNTPDVARMHYLQTHDEHFSRAVAPRTNRSTGTGPESGGLGGGLNNAHGERTRKKTGKREPQPHANTANENAVLAGGEMAPHQVGGWETLCAWLWVLDGFRPVIQREQGSVFGVVPYEKGPQTSDR